MKYTLLSVDGNIIVLRKSKDLENITFEMELLKGQKT